MNFLYDLIVTFSEGGNFLKKTIYSNPYHHLLWSCTTALYINDDSLYVCIWNMILLVNVRCARCDKTIKNIHYIYNNPIIKNSE